MVLCGTKNGSSGIAVNNLLSTFIFKSENEKVEKKVEKWSERRNIVRKWKMKKVREGKRMKDKN